MKEHLKTVLDRLGVPHEDLGTHSAEPVDYPAFAKAAAGRISRGEAERAVLVCGSGLGMSISANRFRGVRASVVWNEETARLGRAHNDANVLALGGRVLEPAVAERILEVWLETPFEGGRHATRILAIDDS